MEVNTTTTFETIYPSYVMHKHWDMSEEFNDRLFELAAADAVANRVTSDDDARNVGDTSNHLGHLRHNFLVDVKDPAVVTLTQMTSVAIREYLYHAYRYQHEGEIRMMSDTFWQRRAAKENVGINSHTHVQHDIVCTYYPRVVLDDDCPETSLHRGALRFYDPSNVGKHLWPCNNPDHYIGGWYSVQPKTGSMVVFEGHMPHDSTYFEGDERMCIPILCKLDLPNSHQHATIKEIMEVQNGI